MRFKTPLFLLLSLLCPAVATAQIKSDTKEYERDSLIRMVSETEDAQATFWIVQRIGDGFRPDVELMNKGAKIIWVGPPGNYSIDMFVVTEEGPKQFFERISIIDKSNPAPVPPDDTDDNDDDDTDDSTPTPPSPTKYGYAELAFTEAGKIKASSRKALVSRIAANYKSVSAAIRAGGLLTQDAIFDEIIERNNELKSEAAFSDWQPWASAIDAKLSVDLSARISNRDEIAVVFSEIHDGLVPYVK